MTERSSGTVAPGLAGGVQDADGLRERARVDRGGLRPAAQQACRRGRAAGLGEGAAGDGSRPQPARERRAHEGVLAQPGGLHALRPGDVGDAHVAEAGEMVQRGAAGARQVER